MQVSYCQHCKRAWDSAIVEHVRCDTEKGWVIEGDTIVRCNACESYDSVEAALVAVAAFTAQRRKDIARVAHTWSYDEYRRDCARINSGLIEA